MSTPDGPKPQTDAPSGGTTASPPVDATKPASTAPGPEPKMPTLTPTTIVVMGVVALIGVLLILAAWRLWPFSTAVVSTDDAYVTGRVTAMAPQVAGYVSNVLVRDYEFVRAGQPLVQIDDRIFHQQIRQAQGQLDLAKANYDNSVQTVAQDRANVASAQAEVYSARAELTRGGLDSRRLQELASRGSVSERERDQGLATLRADEAAVEKALALVRVQKEKVKSDLVAREGLAAQVATARAALELANINLVYTTVRAPHDGQIGDVKARQGQYVAAGSQIVYFVAREIWIVANFKETQTHFIRTGQPVTLRVDALDGGAITGRVETFAPATGSQFSVLKPDNASGNFTKIVQRVSVKIQIDANQQLAARLRPGLSVVAKVDTRSGRDEDCAANASPQSARCHANHPEGPAK